jgi:hypothetical protein
MVDELEVKDKEEKEEEVQYKIQKALTEAQNLSLSALKLHW